MLFIFSKSPSKENPDTKSFIQEKAPCIFCTNSCIFSFSKNLPKRLSLPLKYPTISSTIKNNIVNPVINANSGKLAFKKLLEKIVITLCKFLIAYPTTPKDAASIIVYVSKLRTHSTALPSCFTKSITGGIISTAILLPKELNDCFSLVHSTLNFFASRACWAFIAPIAACSLSNAFMFVLPCCNNKIVLSSSPN